MINEEIKVNELLSMVYTMAETLMVLADYSDNRYAAMKQVADRALALWDPEV